MPLLDRRYKEAINAFFCSVKEHIYTKIGSLNLEAWVGFDFGLIALLLGMMKK
jgi:hypothetical protein